PKKASGVARRGTVAAPLRLPNPFLSLVEARPVPRPQELDQLRLARARLRAVVVAPARHRRQRHEDRLDPAAGLEAEERAAVVQQVELHVPPAAELLKGPLALAVGRVLAPPGDRYIGVEEAGPAVADERERTPQVPL